MENESIPSGTGIVDAVINDPIPPASAADDQKATEVPAPGADEQNPETPEQQEAKKESRRSRARERQVQELAAARTEARIFKERNEALEAQLRGKPAEQQQSGEPKREAFDDDVAYVRAVAQYDADKLVEAKLKGEREAGQQREQQGRTAAGQQEVARAWVEREKAFMAETKDYEQVVKPFVEEDLGSFSEGARHLIVGSEVGPNLIHHLASNPDVAERIVGLPPLRQIAEIAKLEVAMTKPVGRKASDAPAPPRPPTGSRSAVKGYSDNMTTEEYNDFRKSTGARWAR